MLNMRAYTPSQTPRAEWPCSAHALLQPLTAARGKLCTRFFHDLFGSCVEAYGNAISRALSCSLDMPPQTCASIMNVRRTQLQVSRALPTHALARQFGLQAHSSFSSVWQIRASWAKCGSAGCRRYRGPTQQPVFFGCVVHPRACQANVVFVVLVCAWQMWTCLAMV